MNEAQFFIKRFTNSTNDFFLYYLSLYKMLLRSPIKKKGTPVIKSPFKEENSKMVTITSTSTKKKQSTSSAAQSFFLKRINVLCYVVPAIIIIPFLYVHYYLFSNIRRTTNNNLSTTSTNIMNGMNENENLGLLRATSTSISTSTSTSSTSMSVLPELQTTQKFSEWLTQNQNTPGYRLVQLLQQYLHFQSHAETERRIACHINNSNHAVCIGGVGNNENEQNNKKLGKCNTNQEKLAGLCTQMPLFPSSSSQKTLSVFDMMYIPEANNGNIHILGSEPVCLPLALAGASLATASDQYQNGGKKVAAVELGTYVGFSSRCLGVGLNSTGMESIYHAFDTFSGSRNHQAIMKSMKWIEEYNPTFAKKTSDSFVWLWKLLMQDVYPTAEAHKGFIHKDTMNPTVWGGNDVADLSLLIIDSAKTWEMLKTQLAGLASSKEGMLKKGSIFIMMDFLFTPSQIKAVYGCMRPYLFPVYSSFCFGEHFMFVVTEPFSLGEVGVCMANLEKQEGKKYVPSQNVLKRIEEQIDLDVKFLNGLFPMTDDTTKNYNRGNVEFQYGPEDYSERHENCLKRVLKENLNKNEAEWSKLLS